MTTRFILFTEMSRASLFPVTERSVRDGQVVSGARHVGVQPTGGSPRRRARAALPGRPLRAPVAAAGAGFRGDDGPDPDARDRRDDDHLLRRRRGAPAAAAVPGTRPSRDALADRSEQRQPSRGTRTGELPRLARAGDELRAGGGGRAVLVRFHRRRRTGGLLRIARHGGLLRGAGGRRRARQDLPSGGVPAGQRRRAADARILGTPLRR